MRETAVSFFRRTWKGILACLLALLIGYWIGASRSGTAPRSEVARVQQEAAEAADRVEELEQALAQAQSESAGDKVPAPCKELVSVARSINDLSSEFADLTAQSIENAREGFRAIAAGDIGAINDVTKVQQRINAELTRLSEQAQSRVEPFNRLAQECEAAA